MKVKDSNFELLRIISMLMIVFLHLGTFVVNKSGIELSEKNTFLFQYTRTLSFVAVNIYVMITGYFQSKSKPKIIKVLSLSLQTVFFTTIIYSVFLFLRVFSIEKHEVLRSLLSVLNGTYWFITIYILLFLVAPYINIVIQNSNRTELLTLVSLLFMVTSIWQFYFANDKTGVQDGFGIVSFIFLYILASYIRKYGALIKKLPRITYLLLFFLLGLISLYFDSLFEMKILRYNSPIIVLMTYCLFMFFTQITFQSKVINFVSNYTLGVYLVHEQFQMRIWLWQKSGIKEFLYNSNGRFMFKFLMIGLSVFIISWFIAFLIQRVYQDLIKLYNKNKIR